MIRFFRKICQRCLREGAFSKYLVYAIGEIALVVIGILLALAINNVNEGRKTRKNEQVYLKGLHSDFSASKAKLQELITVNACNYQGAQQIANLMYQTDSLPSEAELSTLLFQTFAYDIAFNPNSSLLDEMVSSGSLKDLSNVGLRWQLTNWNSFLVDIEKQEADLRNNRERLLDLVRNDDYNLRGILEKAGFSEDVMGLPPGRQGQSNLHILQSTTFENNLMIFILTSILTETEHYQPLMVDLDRILSTLEEEIEE